MSGLFCSGRFVEQIGLPLPAVWLLVAGGFGGGGKLNVWAALGVTFVACLVADSIWCAWGGAATRRALGLLCRISLEPDSCVRRTQDVFRALRDARAGGFQIHSWLEHAGIAAGGKFGYRLDAFLILMR